ncbi:MAG: FHA domain-containing protein [Candidatus Eremiobacteraeota bacterium]|nr:FHA domain-containing protein [Candidatus Eremiobacteraeota bacterium]
MDANTIRWESLGLVAGMLALAAWGFAAGQPQADETSPSPQRDLVLRVEVRRPGLPSETLTVPDGCLAGRSRECHIIFDDATVSKQHARLYLLEGRPFVEDLHSTNGTTLNGRRIDAAAALRRGDRIGLGTNLIVLVGALPALTRQRM